MQTPRRVKKIRFDYSTYLFFWLLAANDAGGARRLGFVFVVRLVNWPARYSTVRADSFLVRSSTLFFVSFSFLILLPRSQ